jgi:hypothetical protein
MKMSTTTMSRITIAHQDSSMISLAMSMIPKPQLTSFLHLPLEIRLQIYSEILYSHPAKHIFLAPEPLQTHHTSYKYHPPAHRSRLPQRSVCKLPTSLLLACRTIYLESRELPFTQCLFTFISQYHPALYCAATFLSTRASWQRESIRSIEIEMLSRNLFPSQGRDPYNNALHRSKSQFVRSFAHIENLRLLVRGASSVGIERLGDGADWPGCMFAELEGLKTVELAFEDESGCELAGAAYLFSQPSTTSFDFAMRYRSCEHEHNIEESDLEQDLHLMNMGSQISGK